jgi:hypothetical protein
MAFLDRIVDGAIILKFKGKSDRAHRAEQASASPQSRKRSCVGAGVGP